MSNEHPKDWLVISNSGNMKNSDRLSTQYPILNEFYADMFHGSSGNFNKSMQFQQVVMCQIFSWLLQKPND